jgi:hypothetical protein
MFHDMFVHDMFTICSFNSPDLDGFISPDGSSTENMGHHWIQKSKKVNRLYRQHRSNWEMAR